MKILKIIEDHGVVQIIDEKSKSCYIFANSVSLPANAYFIKCNSDAIQDKYMIGSLLANNSHLEIQPSKTGLGLFVKEYILLNSVVFIDIPLVFIDECSIDEFLRCTRTSFLTLLSHTPKQHCKVVANYLLPSTHFSPIYLFSSLSKEMQAKVLLLSCPLNSLPSYLLQSLYDLSILFQKIPQLHLESISIDNIVRLMVICASNVFGNILGEHPLDDDNSQWVALFEYGCRMNHSCLPNCSWIFKENKLHVIAIRDIPPNTELSQSYLERERWFPTHLRRQYLWESRLFTCECEACSQEFDLKRRFKCCFCNNSSSMLIRTAHSSLDRYKSVSESEWEGAMEDRPVINNGTGLAMKCDICHKIDTDLTRINALLAMESEWEKAVADIIQWTNAQSQSQYSSQHNHLYQQHHQHILYEDRDKLVRKVWRCWQVGIREAPGHWTMAELSDFLHSFLLQSQIQREASEEMDPHDTLRIREKLTLLQLRRLVTMRTVYPVSVNLYSWISCDILHTIQELVSMRESLMDDDCPSLSMYREGTEERGLFVKEKSMLGALKGFLEDRKYLYEIANVQIDDYNQDEIDTIVDFQNNGSISSSSHLINLIYIIISGLCVSDAARSRHVVVDTEDT